ncbi:MAG: DUF3021 domain-containing protein [Clostridia bacterium]|nr:DUF3021 domain-containing protein [Clostridia bacterium]
MRTKKKFWRRLLIGAFAGAILCNLIALLIVSLSGGSSFYSQNLARRLGSPAAAVILQTLLSMLIGMTGMGGMSLYDETDLPLAAATAIHFGVIEAVDIPVALLLGWLEPKLSDIGVMTAMLFVSFVMIWLIMFFIGKQQAKKLNEMSQKK